MHLKKVTSKYKDKTYEYAQIVKSVRREDGKSSIKVVKSLGRIESEEDWKKARKIKEAMEKDEEVVRLKDIKIKQQFELGLCWVSRELWERCGIGKALQESLKDRKPEFDPKEIIFLLTVNRLYRPGSDLSAYRWIRDRAWPRKEIKPQWIYRTLDLLAEEKEQIEEKLLEKLEKELDLDLGLVFYDLTSSYFEGRGPELAEFGYSRDHRKDRKQLVLGVLMADGIPIAHRLWPGNRKDETTLRKTVEDLRERFGIQEVVFVADRGVISKDNLEELEQNFDYILATPRRKSKLSKELLRKEVPGSREQRAREVHQEREKGKRWILCLNEDRREKDLQRLEEAVEEGKKMLQDLEKRYESKGRGRPMSQKGVWKRIEKKLGRNQRLFEVEAKDQGTRELSWELDQKALKFERSIQGKFLLVTTSDLEPVKVVEEYKNLEDVERAFDDLKNLLKVRPIYHQTEKRTRGHLFVSILSLLLEKLMERETNRTFRDLKEEMESLKVNRIGVCGEEIYKRNSLDSEQEKILEGLETEKPPKILANV
ncbi:IS1634 family transposase [archaeon SCG-AAA382B04]|nr:IS1634 family transposase [archaeon SCG-AAA382B04]